MDTNLLDAITLMALQAGLRYRASAETPPSAPAPLERPFHERLDRNAAGSVSDNPGNGNLSPAP